MRVSAQLALSCEGQCYRLAIRSQVYRLERGQSSLEVSKLLSCVVERVTGFATSSLVETQYTLKISYTQMLKSYIHTLHIHSAPRRYKIA